MEIKSETGKALSLYHKALFWEYSEREIALLPPEFVIPRVTRYGTLNEVVRLFCVYTPEQIIDAAEKDKELDAKEKTFLKSLCAYAAA
jgi:hypothetical protein